MKPLKQEPILNKLAARYVWWEPVAWAHKHPEIFLANVLNLGSWDDILLLRSCINNDTLRMVLENAPPGSFSPRSWHFWNIKLNRYPVPPLPSRTFH